MTDAELVRLAAERVMGWSISPHECQDKQYDAFFLLGDLFRWNQPTHLTGRKWNPLADWSAVGEIAEKMWADGWYLTTDSGVTTADGKWRGLVYARFGKPDRQGVHRHVDFPRAITIAALRAVGAVGEGE